MRSQLTAIIESAHDGYVAFFPKLDIASQESAVADGRENLKEALEFIGVVALLRLSTSSAAFLHRQASY